jgi:hypothetical protein
LATGQRLSLEVAEGKAGIAVSLKPLESLILVMQ